MKFHYCDKVGPRFALLVVRRTGQAKMRASKRNHLRSRKSAKGFPLIPLSTFSQLFQQFGDSEHSAQQQGGNPNWDREGAEGCDVSPKAQPGKWGVWLVSHKGCEIVKHSKPLFFFTGELLWSGKGEWSRKKLGFLRERLLPGYGRPFNWHHSYERTHPHSIGWCLWKFRGHITAGQDRGILSLSNRSCQIGFQ